MYSSKMSLKSFVLVASFILYFIDQASAYRCYVCASTAEGECYKNPKQEHKFECSNMGSLPEFERNQFSNFGTMIKKVFDNHTGNRDLFQPQCMTILGESANQKAVLRTCSPKIMTCDAWKGELQTRHTDFKIESCDVCESDMCNSSHHLRVGLLSLIGSLLTIFFMRM